MSVKVMAKIWPLCGIPSTTKYIVVRLADYADDGGKCWPSVRTVAKECGVSPRTVQNAINWAEQHGLIKREMRPGSSTIYYLTPEQYSPPQNLRPADYDAAPADTAHPLPQDVRPTPADYDNAYIAEPSIEPSVEPPTEPLPAHGQLTGTVFQNRRTIDQAVNDWNDFAAELQLPKVQRITGSRKSKLNARLRDCGGIEGWRIALQKLRGAKWMYDGTARNGWKADFDFLLQESSFTRLMEGSYGSVNNTKQQAPKLSAYEQSLAACY